MKLKELRKGKHLTQEELANQLKIGRVNYCRYEQEQTKPDLQTLIKIADYYNVSLDYLCSRTWNNQVGYIPEERKNLITQIINLSDEDFNNVVQLLNGYLFAKKDTADALKVFKD